MRVYLPELVVPGKRLGRVIDHDPQSLRYLLPDADTVASVSWERHIPILDQGNVGSCTGNALVGALGTGPLYDALVRSDEQYLPIAGLNEDAALKVYSDAEKLDGGAGLPSEDQGSSGLSVAKVAQRNGLITGFQHATTVAAAHTAIQAGPFLLGCSWFTGMDTPTPEGIVQATGTVRGGHETECDEYDATRDLWWLCNSWSTSWGLAGKYAVDTPTLTRLLAEGGDITSLVPLTQPTPTPAPPVTVDPAVQSFLAAAVGTNSSVLSWAMGRHYREAGDVARQIRALGQAAGITR